MAINIFSGGGSKGTTQPKNTTPNGTAGSVPITGGKSATSTLKTAAKTIGGLAAKYGNLIPGVGGIVSTVGKLVSQNDPEWWENVPGTGVSTNIPLSSRTDEAVLWSSNTNYNRSVTNLRPAVLEFRSSQPASSKIRYPVGDDYLLSTVIYPTEEMIATYLAQNVRKVVNAIPLQAARAYRDVLANQATIYAMKHCLDKYIVLTTQSKPYIPAMTDGSFEVLAPENYSILVGMRDRLAEHCKASVRLPHTLCQYLAWRFGRIYRTGASDKCGIVLYNVLALDRPINDYIQFVNGLLDFVASPKSYFYEDNSGSFLNTYSNSEKLQAQADLYNAYLHHITDVSIPLDTQYIYDPKEFVLRTNCDIGIFANFSNVPAGYESSDVLYMDSLLDNKTTFMASTVSTRFMDDTLHFPLFPIMSVSAYGSGSQTYYSLSPLVTAFKARNDGNALQEYNPMGLLKQGKSWWSYDIASAIARQISTSEDTTLAEKANNNVLVCVTLCKALEFYNVEIYTSISTDEGGIMFIDMTAMSQDMALVSAGILKNTQVYAFANLVTVDVTSYAAKEAKSIHADSTAAVKDIVTAAVPDRLNVVPLTASGQKAEIGTVPKVPTPT